MSRVGKRLTVLFIVAALVTSGLLGAVSGSAAGAASSSESSVWPLLIAPVQREGLFYLMTSQRCGSERCLHLYRTRDVERTLRLAQVRMPPYGRLARTRQGTVMAMVFATPKIGYVLEGNSEAQELYVTINGAHSWQRSPIPRDDTVWGLTATSTHLYALFVHCSVASHGCNYLDLEHAPLRATWWRGVKVPSGAFSEQPLGQVTGHGEMMMFAELSKKTERIYVSHDGGRTFVSSTHPNLKGSLGCSLVAEDVQRVWAVCSGKTHESFHFSDDSGSSWSVFVRQPHNVDASGIFSLTGENDFAYVYTGGATRNIVRMNLGANREHVAGTLGCRSVASMIFINVGDGYAICNLVNGATEFERSINGGESWGRVVVPR
jgi:hypothetical protein